VTVLVVAIGLESYSFRTAIVESNHTRGTTSWVNFVRRAKAPELPVVLLEDAGALVGLVFALFGVALTLMTGNGVWDGIGTAAIGLLLVCIAAVLALETKSLLLGEAASPEAQDRIVSALSGTPGVERIIHMKTLHLGPEELLVAAKIGVAEGSTSEQVADAIDAAEKAVREAEPTASSIYLEPDIYRADYQRAERPASPAAPTH
jgi:divalent metal cation (Fe/Co/Zn/Cd) transporter